MRASRVEADFTPSADGNAAEAANGMVATAFPVATDAGLSMLEQGGNAADAACAAGLALGVCEPQASGLGGQTLALCHFDGKSVFLDGSSRAPSLAHHEHLTKSQRRYGYRATTVPSTLATYGWLHMQHGSLPWHVIVEPAISVAADGYQITQLQHDLQVRELERFGRVPSGSGSRYFLDGGAPFAVGSKFVQPELAAVLEEIAEGGVESFYQGEIATQIDADMRANDGFLRAEDLAMIPWPIERTPLRRRYRSVTLESAPPPAAGPVLLLVMMMLGNLKSSFMAGSSPERYHLLCETFRKAFLRRIDRPYDPNTYEQIRNKVLLSRNYAAGLASSIVDGIDPSLPLEDPIGEDIEDENEDSGMGETTHLSVMDAYGNAVSMTQSIELVYGSKAAADGLGFLYNNYLLAYETEDPSHPYFLRPNAVPWSTAAPTIIHRNKAPWIAMGSPGSERIFSSMAQFISHVVDQSMPIDQAVEAPRLHCSVGGRVSLEAERFDPYAISHLEQEGYEVVPREAYAFYLGCIQAVLKCQTTPGFQGIADPRRDGTAGGP